jgi:hypothetical protein
MTSTPDLTAPGTEAAPPRSPGAARGASRILIIMVAAVLAQLALIAAFTGVLSNPTLKSAEVGLVAQGPEAGIPLPGITYQPLASEAAARQLVADGSLPAALVANGKSQTLYVDGASGPSLTAALEAEFGAAAHKESAQLTTRDLRPLPASDPRGLGTFLLGIGWVIGGYLGVTLLSRALGPRTRTRRGTLVLLGCTLAYSALSAVAGVVLMDPVMGVLTGSPAQLIGAGTLIVFTVATFTAALMSLLGMPGLIVAIGTLVILGNPTSGGGVPVEMMSGGWRFLAHVLPTNAGVSFIRSFAYLDGNQMNDPLTVLLIYTAVSVLVLVGLAIRRSSARPAVSAAPTASATVTPAGTPE